MMGMVNGLSVRCSCHSHSAATASAIGSDGSESALRAGVRSVRPSSSTTCAPPPCVWRRAPRLSRRAARRAVWRGGRTHLRRRRDVDGAVEARGEAVAAHARGRPAPV